MKKPHDEPIDMDFCEDDKLWKSGWKSGFIAGMIVTALVAACFLMMAVIVTMKAMGG